MIPCPFCGAEKARVAWSRPDGSALRRRRVCEACSRRFDTRERIDRRSIAVAKRDGTRQPWRPEKLAASLAAAAHKLAMPPDFPAGLVDDVEMVLYGNHEALVPADLVHDLALRRLACVSVVAAHRYEAVGKRLEEHELTRCLGRVRQMATRHWTAE